MTVKIVYDIGNFSILETTYPDQICSDGKRIVFYEVYHTYEDRDKSNSPIVELLESFLDFEEAKDYIEYGDAEAQVELNRIFNHGTIESTKRYLML